MTNQVTSQTNAWTCQTRWITTQPHCPHKGNCSRTRYQLQNLEATEMRTQVRETRFHTSTTTSRLLQTRVTIMASAQSQSTWMRRNFSWRNMGICLDLRLQETANRQQSKGERASLDSSRLKPVQDSTSRPIWSHLMMESTTTLMRKIGCYWERVNICSASHVDTSTRRTKRKTQINLVEWAVLTSTKSEQPRFEC